MSLEGVAGPEPDPFPGGQEAELAREPDTMPDQDDIQPPALGASAGTDSVLSLTLG